MSVFKLQNTAKSIFKDLDLYGIPVLMECLKRYQFFSSCSNSIPTEGSPTRPTSRIKGYEAVTEVKKLIAHKNGNTTIVTNIGYYQFWTARTLNDN